jgi:hypothetical protein
MKQVPDNESLLTRAYVKTKQVPDNESLLTRAYVKTQEMVKIAKELSEKITSTNHTLIPPFPFPDEYFG